MAKTLSREKNPSMFKRALKFPFYVVYYSVKYKKIIVKNQYGRTIYTKKKKKF